jgi:adenylate kinase/phosphoserine phosphatase
MKLCNRRICIIGARGVGKSHAIRELLPELKNCKHVIGSDLLNAELKRHGLESMEGLDEITKEVLRQFASEEMVRRASNGCDIFICEGHAALIPSKPLSYLEKAWRQLLVWIGKRESIFDISVGFTELDKAFFNEVILVEADVEVIQERRLADLNKQRATDMDSIRADMEAERSKAAEICRESGAALRVVDANISTLARDTLRGLLTANGSMIETVPMYHQRKILERAQGLPNPGREQPIFLFDADNTLGPYDASKLILKFLGNGTYERMKKNFERGYSHYSFLMHHHIHVNAGDRFDACVQGLGLGIKLSDEVVSCLRDALSKGPVVILTAGIPEVWRIALRAHGLRVGTDYSSEIVVHGLVDGVEGLVMDEQGKETFARAAKEKGYYVVASGDSQIDTGMLRIADAAFVVARDFGEYQLDISMRSELKSSKKSKLEKIKNERLFILTAGHPRIFQIPADGMTMAIGGPQLSSFKDLIHDALRSDFVKKPPANYDDYFPLWVAWSESLPTHPKNKNVK